MKKDIMEKWVAALRSGDYKQGQDQLRSEYDEFCCLGVLCNLHAQEHPSVAAKNKHKEYYCGSYGTLPNSVIKWAGFKNGNEDGSYGTSDLASENDNGKSFKQLAKIIEKNYKDL